MWSFLPGPLSAWADGSGPVLILGFEGRTALCVVDTGELRVILMEALRTDWRYNWKDHVWIEPAEELSGDAEETAGDGGPEVPGYLPDAD